MKVPPHHFKATVAFYRDTVGLKPIMVKAPQMSQAEIWLELFTDDFAAAADHLAKARVVHCDAIEPLPEDFKGGWITSPASIVHMVREPDVW